MKLPNKRTTIFNFYWDWLSWVLTGSAGKVKLHTPKPSLIYKACNTTVQTDFVPAPSHVWMGSPPHKKREPKLP